MLETMDRNELIAVVTKIMECDGSESEINLLLEILKQNVSDPNVSDLIFWPETELTPEQVVDKALSYKPILL
ncbi:hypothetical protein A1QM_18260 [Vibrio genomosp. F10 str. 9ZC157]|nr:hypothetical protein A1QM_18260 [Vibrio genomosp. F10 str. 9ZC157]